MTTYALNYGKYETYNDAAKEQKKSGVPGYIFGTKEGYTVRLTVCLNKEKADMAKDKIKSDKVWVEELNKGV